MPNINIDDAYILNETGAQVDKVTGLYFKDESTSAAEKAFAQLNIGTAGSNRNLLDNPWFNSGNVINQRGATTIPVGGYGIDRWKGGSAGAVAVVSDGLQFNGAGNTYQVPPNGFWDNFIGKTMTASLLFSDGTVQSGSGLIGNGVTEFGTFNGVRIYKSGSNNFNLQSTSDTNATVRAVKLELGSVSTLANDAPPDYASELMKCQYYFQRIKGTGTNYGPVGVGYALSTSSAAIIVPLAAPLRRTTVTVSSSGNLSMLSGGTAHTPNSVSYYDHTDQQLRLNCVVSNSLTSGNYCYLQFAQNAAYIDLSADL